MCVGPSAQTWKRMIALLGCVDYNNVTMSNMDGYYPLIGAGKALDGGPSDGGTSLGDTNELAACFWT